MSNKAEITIKINIETHRKLLELKKKTGASIKWIVDTAVENFIKVKRIK